MKKGLSILLALTLCLLMAACGGGQKEVEPAALYKSAVAQMDKENMAATMLINADVETGGITTNVTMDMNMAMKKTGEDATMAMEMSIGAQGMTMDMAVYVADGYSYVNVFGMKVKQAVEDSETDLYGQFSGMSGGMLLDESALTIEKAEQQGGNTVISFTVAKDKLDELLQLLNSQLVNGASNIQVGSVSGTVTIGSNEQLVGETLEIVYSMEINGETAKATMTMEMKDIAFGDNVTVELPEDLDEYLDSGNNSIAL